MNVTSANHPSDQPSGFATMSPAMAEMRSYPRYLFGLMEACIGERVWEIGVGHGTYTAWLLDRGIHVLGSDVDRDCLRLLAEKHAGDSHLQLAHVDLNIEPSVRAVASFAADSVICLNVLEHIEQDVNALAWIRQACASGAMLGLVVPAHHWLFGRMDAEAGHFRRYTRRSVSRALQNAGWQVQRVHYVNALGALGWWYHNRWRTSAGLADTSVNQQMRAADRWLPRVARCTDPWLRYAFGLSVVAHARSQ